MREVIACDQGHYGITQVTILVNDKEFWVTEDCNREPQFLTYDNLVSLAGKPKNQNLKVTVKYKPGNIWAHANKFLKPGDKAVVVEDMMVDVV